MPEDVFGLDLRSILLVGMTGWTPERRFEAHLNGYKSSSYVTKYGRELMPRIYEGLNPMTYDEGVPTAPFLNPCSDTNSR